MRFGFSPGEIRMIRGVLSKFNDVESAIIFGSRALGNFKPGSDVDIALKGALMPDTARKVASELGEEIPLPYFFDVVAYAEIGNPDLQAHIDEFGVEFYRREEAAAK